MILSWLLSKFGIYAISGLLISALAGGGWLYVKHLRSQNDALKAEVSELQQAVFDRDAAIEYYKKAVAIDADTSKLKKEINEAVRNNDFNRINELYRVFSDKANKANGGPGGDTGDGKVDRKRD